MTASRFRMGAGFNPALLRARGLPGDISYVEGGHSLFRAIRLLSYLKERNVGLSLHLARVPTCENRSIQNAYIDSFVHALPADAESVGMHLCGPLRSGLGRLGIGTSFIPDNLSCALAAAFFDRLVESIDRPILIENANFYDRDAEQVIATVAYTSELCEAVGATQILDLAHLIVSARNSGLDPYYLLGKVRLEIVSTVHLSGLGVDHRGVYHDGHNQPVTQEVWDMLRLVLDLTSSQVLTVVLEHTDPIWSDRADTFNADIEQLQALALSARRPPGQPLPLEELGLGYLANVIFPQRFSMLAEAMGPESFRTLVYHWGEDFLRRTQGESMFVSIDIPPVGPEQTVINVASDFAEWVNERAPERT